MANNDKIGILIKSLLQAPSDAEINKLKKDLENKLKNVKINTKGSGIKLLDTQEIDIYVKKMENAISRLKIGKDKVFANSGVQDELKKLQENLDLFKSKGDISTKQVGLQFDNLRTKVAEVSNSFKNVNKDGYSFSQMIELAGKKIAIWGISTTLVYGSFRKLKESISYITELDNSLNEIRIVTNKNQEEVNALALSYNKLAKEMSVTTKEISSEAANLFRQGLNESQVEERMKAIIQYAKISSISIADSDKIITATANATGESVNKIIDIFALLGDITSSGADEIGEALQRVASTSEGMNVSLEKSSSWIATISSITRESASTIGRSLNSMMSRYSQIKEAGFNDEDATKLNDVVSALTQIGVKALDSKGQLRDFSLVMDDLGSIYGSLDTNSQSYIASVMAGTYQMNRFKTLMQNYGDSLKNYESALNSAGTAQQKFNIYLESPQAKIDRLTASWEGLIQKTLSSEWVKNAVDGLSSVVIWLDEANAVVPILAGVIGGILTTSIISLNGGVKALNLELIKTNALTAGLPLLIGLATTGVTAYFMSVSNAEKEQKQYIESFKRLNNEYKNSKQAIDSQVQSQNAEVELSQRLATQLDELSQKTFKTNEEKMRMSQIVDELNTKIPNLALSINSETGELNKQTEEIYKTIDAYKQYLFVQAGSKKATESATTLINAEEIKRQAQAEIDKNNLIIDRTKERAEQRFGKNGYIDDSSRSLINKALKDRNEAQKVLDENQKIIDQANTDIQKSFDLSSEYSKKYGSTYDFKTVNPYTKPDLYTGGSNSSSNGSGTDKNPEKYRLEKDRYMGLSQAISDANNALELNNSLSENASNEEKLKLLDERIILYQNLGKAINDMTWEQKQESNELQEYLKLQGVQFDNNNIVASSYDDLIDKQVAYINSLKSGDERTAAIQDLENLKDKAKDYMSLISDKIPKGYRDMLKITGDINKAEADKLDILEKQKKEIEDQIKTELEANKKLQEQLQKQNDEKLKAIEEAEDKIRDIYKKSLEEEKDRLDEQLNDYEEFINDKIKLLNKENEAEDYAKNVNEQRQKIQDIQQQINERSMDTSYNAYQEVKELEKQKAEEIAKLEEMQTNRSRDLQKDNLQNQADDFKKHTDKRKEQLNEQFSDEQINIKAKEALLNGLTGTITLANGQVLSLESAFMSFESKSSEGIATLSNRFLAFAQAVSTAKSALNNLDSVIGGSSGNNPLGMSKSDFAIYLQNKKSWTDGNISDSIIKQNADLRRKYGIRTDEYNYEQLKGYYADGGVNNFTGTAMLHGKSNSVETIFNATQGKSLFDFVNNLPRILPNFNIKQPQFSNAGGIGGINLSINIAGNTDKNTISQIQQAGYGLLNDLKKQLNKNGRFN